MGSGEKKSKLLNICEVKEKTAHLGGGGHKMETSDHKVAE